MKMVGFNKGSSVDEQGSLFDMEGATPVPGPREVLVQVRAVGVNPLDTKVRAGRVDVPERVVTLGWDVAGIVHSVGSDYRRLRFRNRYALIRKRYFCNRRSQLSVFRKIIQPRFESKHTLYQNVWP